LFKQGVYQSSLTMINVGDNSYISYIVAIIHNIPEMLSLS